MDKPRRRSAGRPAGPPDATPPEVTSPADDVMQRPAETNAAGSTTPDDGRASEPAQHRRRQRQTREDGQRRTAPAAEDAQAAPSHRRPPPVRDDRRRESAMERSLRALVSTRTTQLPPTVAMRAREVAAPSAADLAEAEQELVIVRRFYVPPAPLVAGKAPEPHGTDTREPKPRAEGRRGSRRPQRGGGA